MDRPETLSSSSSAGVAAAAQTARDVVDQIRSRSRVYTHRPITGDEALLRAAVLVPLYYVGDELHVILTKRTSTVAMNQGQISFPGGVREVDDPDLLATALRESFEEIGLDAAHVEVFCRIDDFSTANGQFLIAGFLGLIEPGACPYPWRPSEGEVAEILEVPLSHLLDPANIRVSEPRELNGRLWPNETFLFRGHQVFGATARALRNVLDLGLADPA